MDLIIFSLNGIVQLFTNPAMFSLLGLIGLAIIVLAVKILLD